MTIAGERVLGSVTPEQAGTGAAVSEAASELGGALGIALLGSIGTAAYRSYADAHLPHPLAGGPAGDSLAEALGVAGHLPGAAGRLVAETARTAYVHGLHAAALAGALLLVAAAVTVVGSRGRR